MLRLIQSVIIHEHRDKAQHPIPNPQEILKLADLALPPLLLLLLVLQLLFEPVLRASGHCGGLYSGRRVKIYNRLLFRGVRRGGEGTQALSG